MELKLDVKLQQKLSPQMIQSMAILQMGAQELQEHVEKTLMENPVLELGTATGTSEQTTLLQKLEWLNSTDRQNRWYHQEDAQDLADLVPDAPSVNLYDHLRQQLDMNLLPARLSIAVDCVLSGLDRNGYLDETTEELSMRCGQPFGVILRAEALVQSLEPAGVAARTLSECLSIQLKRIGQTGLPLTIVQHHLESMAKNHYHSISQKTGASREAIHLACEQVRALNPKPGAAFSPREAPEYIVPDILVAEENGSLTAVVGDDFLPVLKVSSYYHSLMSETEDTEVKAYLTDKVQQADQLIKNIEHRKNTLLNCAQVIIAHQSEFFFKSTGHLVPLTLADIAAELGIHESTVSRAIHGKYLQCRQGVLPLSHFFSRSIAGNSEDISVQNVKLAIKAIIDAEDKKRPLSDQKICGLLAHQDIPLSRRTVAKYRDELGIPSTQARRGF